ncbi:hypothetical protein [Xanthomonas campestris]|uniref:hypothetical protein n=1 Tax=Xanthomonas campestris TaxID=339 RepID=UPI00096F32EB|nr:hypothetical protein [Xanthomonas campestris]WVL61780.1 hypothetical protein LLE68_005145 [Xanthomonas campestris pv. barbareae]
MREEGELTDDDHGQLDDFLGNVLDQHKDGGLSRGEAIGLIAHVMAALDLHNYTEARSWFANHRKFIEEGKRITRSSGR